MADLIYWLFALGFVFWVVSVLWVVLDTEKNKNKNRRLWIILAIIFGVLGALIYFIARPTRKVERGFVTCPKCGRAVEKLEKGSQAYCPVDGYVELYAQSSRASVGHVNSSTKIKKEELLRSAMNALEKGEIELAKKFMDEAQKLPD